MSSAVENVLGEIVIPGKPLRGSELSELTDLSPADMELFKHTWGIIEPKRRREIAGRLVELAMDDVELSFNGVFKHFLGDEDQEVRRKGIEGLWEDEDVSLIGLLVNLLLNDRSNKVQAEAAEALGKFTMLGEQGKIRPIYMAGMLNSLLAVAGDQDRTLHVRRRALEAAAPLSVAEVKTAIMAAHQSGEPELVAGAIYAMGRSSDSSWLPLLLNELEGDDAELRCEAAGACGELEDAAAVPYLIALVDAPDIDVRLAAIGALGKIGGSEARKRLEQCLKSPLEAVRQSAREAFQEIALEENPLPLPKWDR